MTTYMEIAQALVNAGYLTDAGVVIAAALLEDSLIISEAQDAIAAATADEAFQTCGIY